MPSTERRLLPDLLAPNLRIVFCGSAVGPESARRQAYYAGRGNAFWRVLFEVGLTPGDRPLQPAEYRDLLRFDIGLTDMVKAKSALDADLRSRDNDPAGLRATIERYQPRVLAFNGKRAARVFLGRLVEYGEQAETLGATRIFVLPSTSGAARRYWDVEYWKELARLLDRPSNQVR